MAACASATSWVYLSKSVCKLAFLAASTVLSLCACASSLDIFSMLASSSAFSVPVSWSESRSLAISDARPCTPACSSTSLATARAVAASMRISRSLERSAAAASSAACCCAPSAAALRPSVSRAVRSSSPSRSARVASQPRSGPAWFWHVPDVLYAAAASEEYEDWRLAASLDEMLLSSSLLSSSSSRPRSRPPAEAGSWSRSSTFDRAHRRPSSRVCTMHALGALEAADGRHLHLPLCKATTYTAA
mmetsp:Transcript_21539/g.62392  ORF Transcript_21539/g.62392 Transcript_21539/m.62392 type:complete len:247 (-) Transcript_21539:275-1015(-)